VFPVSATVLRRGTCNYTLLQCRRCYC